MKKSGAFQMIFLLSGVMVGLLALSFIYYKERIGYQDTATYLVNIVREGTIDVHHFRFISVVSEWLPLFFLKCNASFNTIALSYSFVHSLIPVSLSLICLFVFKNVYKALGILLFWVLMTTQLYYYICCEFQVGLVFLLFYDAFIDYYTSTRKSILFLVTVSLLILPAIIFSHPISILVTAAWIVYRYVITVPLSKVVLALVLFISGGAYAVKKLFFTSSYEASKNPDIGKALHQLSPDIYIGKLATTFYDNILSDAFIVPLLLLLTIVMLIIRKKKLEALIFFLIVAGFYTMVLLVFQTSETVYNQYFEHLLQPLPWFIVLAFTDHLEGFFRAKWVETSLLILIFTISICKIVNGSRIISERHEMYYGKFAVMEQCGSHKALISRDELPWGVVPAAYWNSADETLFLSSLKGSHYSKTLYYVWPWMLEDAIRKGDEGHVLGDDYAHPIERHPERYFGIWHQRYTLIKHDTCIKPIVGQMK